MHNYAPSLRAHVLWQEGRRHRRRHQRCRRSNKETSEAQMPWLKAYVSLPSLLRWTWRHPFHVHIFWDEHDGIRFTSISFDISFEMNMKTFWDEPGGVRVFRDIFWNEHEGTRFTSIFVEMSRKAFVSLQYLLTWTWSHSFHFHIFWDVHEGIRFTPISFEENISSPFCWTRVLLFVIEWSVHIFYPSPSDVMLDPHFVDYSPHYESLGVQASKVVF